MLEQELNQSPFKVTMLNLQGQRVEKSLKENSRFALKNFLASLEDKDPDNLYEMFLAEVEQPMLDVVMQYTRGNQTRAATMLGLNRGTLRKKLKKYGLD